MDIVAAERGIDVRNVGSMLFKRTDLARGFEPNTSFYIQNKPRVRSVAQIDATLHPPPDLVIAIDISQQSLNTLLLYAAFGVPEVWRVEDGIVTIYVLRADSARYDVGGISRVLPPIDGTILTDFLAQHHENGRAAWVRAVREWAATAQ